MSRTGMQVILIKKYTIKYFVKTTLTMPVPVAVRSKAQVYGRSPAEIVGSNPTQGMDICLL